MIIGLAGFPYSDLPEYNQTGSGPTRSSYLEDEGAFGRLDVEGAALGVQRTGEGGAAQSDPAQRRHILW